MKVFIGIFLIILVVINLLLSLKIIDYIDNSVNPYIIILKSIKNYTKNLFTDRNKFGIIISSIILFISIPAIILCFILQIVIWIMTSLYMIYELGSK